MLVELVSDLQAFWQSFCLLDLHHPFPLVIPFLLLGIEENEEKKVIQSGQENFLPVLVVFPASLLEGCCSICIKGKSL
jgi:hypothetical protein